MKGNKYTDLRKSDAASKSFPYLSSRAANRLSSGDGLAAAAAAAPLHAIWAYTSINAAQHSMLSGTDSQTMQATATGKRTCHLT